MATAADISFAPYISERTIGGVQYPPLLYFVGNTPPYRVDHSVGGRGETYGHYQGVMRRGIGYWAGVVEFHRLYLKPENYPGIGYIRAAIAELSAHDRTFAVPMDTQYDKGLVRFVSRSTGAEINHSQAVGSMRTAAGNQFGLLADADGNAVDIVLLPGAYFTIDHALYQATATAGEQTVTAAAVQCIPDFPDGTGTAIELDEPYAVGRIPIGQSVRPQEQGHISGGWVLPWVQAED